MGREPGDEERHGRNYTKEECNLTAQGLVRGFSTPRLLAKAMKRGTTGIGHLFNRICWNASADYDAHGPYELKPLCSNICYELNCYAQQFIECQMFGVKKKSNARKIANQFNLSLHVVEEFIREREKMPRKKKDETGFLFQL